jgi:hypothetical protein
MKISYFKQVFAVSCALVTSGCANIVETKTIVSNSNEYMAENFTPMQLAQPIRDVLNRGETYPKLFSKIDFTQRSKPKMTKKFRPLLAKEHIPVWVMATSSPALNSQRMMFHIVSIWICCMQAFRR